NLDGKPDLVVGLLDEPTFLLTNTSPVEDRRWLSLRLVGTISARDAVGTTITAEFEDSTQTHQLTAGDGYQCSNERVIYLGCGDAPQVDRLTILWPSGIRQEMQNVSTTTRSRTILVEGHDIPLPTDPRQMKKSQNH